jgi:hypothetical protein
MRDKMHTHNTNVVDIMSRLRPANICSICGDRYSGSSHNPWPFDGEGCCATCNGEVVVPARFARFAQR